MITVLTCNGWSALYDANGKRVGEFQVDNLAPALRLAGIEVTERVVPVLPSYPDFPVQLPNPA